MNFHILYIFDIASSLFGTEIYNEKITQNFAVSYAMPLVTQIGYFSTIAVFKQLVFKIAEHFEITFNADLFKMLEI